jgi:hypothetical protein
MAVPSKSRNSRGPLTRLTLPQGARQRVPIGVGAYGAAPSDCGTRAAKFPTCHDRSLLVSSVIMALPDRTRDGRRQAPRSKKTQLAHYRI